MVALTKTQEINASATMSDIISKGDVVIKEKVSITTYNLNLQPNPD